MLCFIELFSLSKKYLISHISYLISPTNSNLSVFRGERRKVKGLQSPRKYAILLTIEEKGGNAVERLRPLLERYDRILVFDTETTGLRFDQDEIIQFSAAVVMIQDGAVTITEEIDLLLLLPEGKQVPPEITRLTGITTEEIREKGIPRQQACREISALMDGNTLLCAYNAHFDLCFLYHLFLLALVFSYLTLLYLLY